MSLNTLNEFASIFKYNLRKGSPYPIMIFFGDEAI